MAELDADVYHVSTSDHLCEDDTLVRSRLATAEQPRAEVEAKTHGVLGDTVGATVL